MCWKEGEVLRMQTWHEAPLSKVSVAQLCQVPESKSQAGAGTSHAGNLPTAAAARFVPAPYPAPA